MDQVGHLRIGPQYDHVSALPKASWPSATEIPPSAQSLGHTHMQPCSLEEYSYCRLFVYNIVQCLRAEIDDYAWLINNKSWIWSILRKRNSKIENYITKEANFRHV